MSPNSTTPAGSSGSSGSSATSPRSTGLRRPEPAGDRRDSIHAMSTTATATRPGVGELMKEWRSRRRRSQLDLSSEVGVSTRHLSFVETGRSRPSPELVLAVAEHLEVPLRDRNTMLLAAGYAPRFQERPIDDPAMAGVRTALRT